MADVKAGSNVIGLVSGKWALPVMNALDRGPRGYNEIIRAVDVDHKTLDRTLCRLQRDSLVARFASPIGAGPARRARYRLTPQGRTVLTVINVLGHWWDGNEDGPR